MTQEVRRSFSELLRSFVDDAASLAQLDARLLRAELRASVGSLVAAAALVVVALSFVIFGLAFLGEFLKLALIALGMPPLYAALTLAVLCLVVAGACALIALARLKAWSIVPRRTMAQVGENISVLKASFADARGNS